MRIRALAISIGARLRVGTLFQYGREETGFTTRFVADGSFEILEDPPVLSSNYLAARPEDQRALWANISAPRFNGRQGRDGDWQLPAFFQNLLPEGVFRDHVAELRKCDPKDHFEILAACGGDLPGNVFAFPIDPDKLGRDELTRYVTQSQDALEVTVVAEPIEGAISLSGMQPKIGAVQDGDRYVARARDGDTHIIGKLPVVGYPRLPEVECLSLQMAKAAGVNVCEATLAPLSSLLATHGYDLGDATPVTNLLAVKRFDRSPSGRIHCEDFAQILGVMPEDKYRHSDASYLNVARFLMARPSLGEPAVHELLRRIMVNQLIGNVDMHLKNIGLRYPDGRTPELSPAYDVVAYSVYANQYGHGLSLIGGGTAVSAPETKDRASQKPRLSTASIRAFCAALGIAEKPATKAVKGVVKNAHSLWPAMLANAALTEMQKQKFTAYFNDRLTDLGVKPEWSPPADSIS